MLRIEWILYLESWGDLFIVWMVKESFFWIVVLLKFVDCILGVMGLKVLIVSWFILIGYYSLKKLYFNV